MSQFVCPECGCTECVDVRGVGILCKKCHYSPKLMCQVRYDNVVTSYKSYSNEDLEQDRMFDVENTTIESSNDTSSSSD
jgi:hypothetical protein